MESFLDVLAYIYYIVPGDGVWSFTIWVFILWILTSVIALIVDIIRTFSKE